MTLYVNYIPQRWSIIIRRFVLRQSAFNPANIFVKHRRHSRRTGLLHSLLGASETSRFVLLWHAMARLATSVEQSQRDTATLYRDIKTAGDILSASRVNETAEAAWIRKCNCNYRVTVIALTLHRRVMYP